MAKCYGGYANIIEGCACETLHDLTSAPSFTHFTSDDVILLWITMT